MDYNLPFDQKKIFVKAPKGETLTIYCEHCDTVENFFCKIMDSLLGATHQERIRKTENKEFDEAKFIRSIKLFFEGQLIKFDIYRGYLLNVPDDKCSLNIKYGSILYLDKCPFCDIIYDGNKKLRLNIPYDSNIIYIRDIKEQIKKELKIEIKNQELTVNGKTLQDSENLGDFTNIELKIKMSVCEYQELYNKINNM
jgi:predicted transport protein